jgi:hypothetical protein
MRESEVFYKNGKKIREPGERYHREKERPDSVESWTGLETHRIELEVQPVQLAFGLD